MGALRSADRASHSQGNSFVFVYANEVCTGRPRLLLSPEGVGAGIDLHFSSRRHFVLRMTCDLRPVSCCFCDQSLWP